MVLTQSKSSKESESEIVAVGLCSTLRQTNVRVLCEMWPVRTRRGTRKRCAALFVVGVCAAVMVLTRPFISTQMAQVDDESVALPPAPPVPLDAFNGSSLLVADDNTDTFANRLLSLAARAIASEVQIKNKTFVVPVRIATNVTNDNKVSTTPGLPAPPTTAPPTVEVVMASTAAIVTSTPPPPTTVAATLAQQQLPEVAPPKAPTEVVAAAAVEDHRNATRAQLPTIYVITPTFPRMEQLPELTRLGQTLLHVPKLHWIVADDAVKRSSEVEALLKHFGMNYTYILGPMPDKYRKKKGGKPKGVANRMAGLEWIAKNADANGVMFFADDDNSYDVRLFEEMRWTRKVSMWPVGLVTHLGVSSPVVRNGKVIGFYDGWIASRKFPVDMAGFAVNVGFLRSRPKAAMPFRAGFEEDGFLISLNITLNDIEPKANNCTKIYVWHTKTVRNNVPQKMSVKDRQKFKNSNLFHLPYIV